MCLFISHFFHLFLLFFFLVLRRPPRSTLFPYRRSSDLGGRVVPNEFSFRRLPDRNSDPTLLGASAEDNVDAEHGGKKRRSEEHTSELQSRGHLVCRLLLEKKKQKDTLNIFQKDHDFSVV